MTDPGRQPERTRFARQRTTLSALVAVLAIERLMADVSIPAMITVAVLSAVALLLPVVALIQGRRLQATPDGRPLLLLATVVVLGCVAALAYAGLR